MSHLLRDWEPIAVAGGGVMLLAIAGGLLTEIGPWYLAMRKPSWKPPDWMFGPVWTLIFVLEATSAVIGWDRAKTGEAGAALIAAYVANGLLNILWSLLFFKMHRPDLALREVGFLCLSVVVMMIVLANIAGAVWLLLVPYLLWGTFASYLNYTIVRLNGPFRVAA